MDDFMFRGRHIREFGAEAAFGSSMRVGAKIARSEYGLPHGGSVIIGEDSYEATTRQVTIIPRSGVEPTPGWRREILAWLQAGRGELMMDNDPGVMRIAQFDADGTWGTAAWPDGALVLNMTLQPLCLAAQEEAQTAGSEGGEARVPVLTCSALEMPLEVAITCLSGTVTDAEITAGGTIRLSGMSLLAGEAIRYSAGMLPGDPVRLEVAGAAGWAHVRRWGRLTGRTGDVVHVSVTGGEVSCRVICRGRWPG